MKLSPGRYFDQRLLSFTLLFASNKNYILKPLSFTEKMKIDNQINVALKKICSDQFRAKYIFSETVTLFITKDDAY